MKAPKSVCNAVDRTRRSACRLRAKRPFNQEWQATPHVLAPLSWRGQPPVEAGWNDCIRRPDDSHPTPKTTNYAKGCPPNTLRLSARIAALYALGMELTKSIRDSARLSMIPGQNGAIWFTSDGPGLGCGGEAEGNRPPLANPTHPGHRPNCVHTKPGHGHRKGNSDPPVCRRQKIEGPDGRYCSRRPNGAEVSRWE